MNSKAKLKHKNNSEKPTAQSAKYVGISISTKVNIREEVQERIRICTVTWQKLQPFWRDSNCPIKMKLCIYGAVIRAKLVYGLESVQLTTVLRNKLNTFQLEGLIIISNGLRPMPPAPLE